MSLIKWAMVNRQVRGRAVTVSPKSRPRCTCPRRVPRACGEIRSYLPAQRAECTGCFMMARLILSCSSSACARLTACHRVHAKIIILHPRLKPLFDCTAQHTWAARHGRPAPRAHIPAWAGAGSSPRIPIRRKRAHHAGSIAVKKGGVS